MRIATFNVESLDLPIEPRAALLRPALERLDGDILCLQEINGQKLPNSPRRSLAALDQLLEGTRYASFHRASTTSKSSSGPDSVHNLVTLSRFPINAQRQVRHELLAPVSVPLNSAMPQQAGHVEQEFDRPLLLTEIDVDGQMLHLVNVHLRAPLASSIPGQKESSFVWKTTSAWAEGYYLSSLKRVGQALELRFLVDQMFDRDPQAWVLVAGDFNVEEHETPMRIILAASEDTGNSSLAARTLVLLERSVPPAKRFSVAHHGRPQMLDHIAASQALYGHFRSVEVHNEAIGDEAVGYALGLKPAGSYHAGVVATFKL